MSYPVTIGIEEEAFVLEHGRLLPTLQSLDYMRRLLWTNPLRYTVRTASNFLRDGDQRRHGLMGSVEVSTGVHCEPDSLMRELLQMRREFARATRGAMVVPVGALFTTDAKTMTSGLHVHIGVPTDQRSRVYENIAYFLPVLAVASASSPYFDGRHVGPSSRMAEPYALGPLREDREYRFQDLIVTKRLGTVEVRLFDPVPEMSRIEHIVRALYEIARYEGTLPFSREEYNGARPEWTRQGLNPWVRKRWESLQPISPLPIELLEETFSSRLAQIVRAGGVLAAYEEADRVWRAGTGITNLLRKHSKLRIVSGVAGFYAVRLPYMAYKGIREWKGSPP